MSVIDPQVTDLIAVVRERAPLVHCVSAAVSLSIVADGLLAAGARPMMTETRQEAPVVTTIADATLINLGTLSVDAMSGIPATVEVANAHHIPWVLDPTAIGLAPVRTPLARELVTRGPAIVRGNASEILALAGQGGGGRGADSRATSDQALDAAVAVAAQTGGVVAVSGAVDLIVDATGRLERVDRGHPLLTRVTGTGCLLGALTAACRSVTEDAFLAALSATIWLDVAGEWAAEWAPRPGSFRVALFDALDEVGR